MKDIRISFQDDEAKIKAKDEKIKLELEESLNLLSETQYHRDLQGLDFESSGHTGFASEKQISILLPKDISILPQNNLQNRNAKIYLYDPSQSNKETQVSVGDLLNTKIRTVSSVPDNLQNGDYIFLERK